MNMMRKARQFSVMGSAILTAMESGLRGIHPLMAVVHDNDLGAATLKRFDQLQKVTTDQDCSHACIPIRAGTFFHDAILSDDWACDQTELIASR